MASSALGFQGDDSKKPGAFASSPACIYARSGRKSKQLMERENGGTLKFRVKKDPANPSAPRMTEIRTLFGSRRRGATLIRPCMPFIIV